ncbi:MULTISPECIES: hypothetical protein [unclassified Pseudoalteromonas]|uniref:hypothetical protein n=1 Tax=unclassified Pseudoalteromonas TaxID=194690 RepID=UPI00301427DA
MLKKLHKKLIVLAVLILISAALVTTFITQWQTLNSFFIFILILLILFFLASLLGLKLNRSLISQVTSIGTELEPADLEIEFEQGFLNGYVQKLSIESHEKGLLLFLKYSKSKKYILIPWCEVQGCTFSNEDNLLCITFFQIDVKLYVNSCGILKSAIEKEIYSK